MEESRQHSAITVRDLVVSYGDKPVLWNVNLTVPTGVLMAVVGPNGAGKSTLIKTILGIQKSIAGEVLVYGEPYLKMRKEIAYVPQKESIDWDFPTTVLDAVLMGTYGQLGWIKRPGKKEKVKALEALDKVGMAPYKNRQISQLSGGQQQRMFLARALVQEASIYIMDEPFQGVDATTEIAIVNILKALRAQGKTVLVVHHDLQTVAEYFDWMTFLNITNIATGPMDAVFNEKNLQKTYGANYNVTLIK